MIFLKFYVSPLGFAAKARSVDAPMRVRPAEKVATAGSGDGPRAPYDGQACRQVEFGMVQRNMSFERRYFF